MVLHRVGEGAEDHALLGELLLERRGDRDAVEDRVDRHTRQPLLLVEGDPELLEGTPHLGIDFVQARERLLRLRRSVVDDVLVVDRGMTDVRPGRLTRLLLELLPMTKRPQAPVEHELRFVLLGGDQPDDVLGQPARSDVGLDVRDESPSIFASGEIVEWIAGSRHAASDQDPARA